MRPGGGARCPNVLEGQSGTYDLAIPAVAGGPQKGCSHVRTVGVEEELLLVDPETGEPQARSAAVLARAELDDAEQGVFEKELHNQMLEFATHPQSGMPELRAEIIRCRKEAARHAGEIGCTVAALATSPLPVSPSVSTNRRYQWMAEHYGIATQEQLVLGCHVHVSVESDEEGVAVLDRIQPWLPVLTALSSNSPTGRARTPVTAAIAAGCGSAGPRPVPPSPSARPSGTTGGSRTWWPPE